MIIFFIDSFFSRPNENTKLREIPDKGFNDNFFSLMQFLADPMKTPT
jgi:hypothetical protein